MSEEEPIREGRCVYCGTARPTSRPICPECGRTWIDTKVGEQLPALTPQIVAASKKDRAEDLAVARSAVESQLPKPRPWGLLVGVAIGLIAVVLAFNTFGGGDDDEAALDTTAAPSSTTTVVSTTTTTAATTTSQATTTTAAPTTTSTTTTTTTTATVPPIEPEGTAVAIEDLTLGAFALGPFAFDEDTSFLGRLVASLGQPDSMTAAGEADGLCAGDSGSNYTWGGLTAVFRTEDGGEILVGYRLVDTEADHPTLAVTTRSGLQLGHTLETLEGIYLQSTVVVENIDGAPHFILLRSSDSATLLWGPLTSGEATGTVTGIYSPDACDGGPRPSG